MERYNYVAFSVLFQEFISFYLREYGEKKAKEISDNINNSKSTSKFFIEADKIKTQLGTDDFLGAIFSNTKFLFAKAETICLASLLILFRWELEIGKPNVIADNEYMNKTFFRIIVKCDKLKTHTSGKPNFFEKFYNHLDNKL